MGKNRARLFLASAFVSCLVAQGCVGERDPVSQIQTGALPKWMFVGEKLDDKSDDPEFFFRTTVVDVSSGASADSLFTNSDAQPTTRIRWEIAEDKLTARLAYELVENTDGKGTTGGVPRNDQPRTSAPASPTTDGQVVASFVITKHFDVRRQYNLETGEENNVIEENDRDRPWAQREYMRVDWSKNLVTDAYDLDAVSQLGLFGGVTWTPLAFQVTDPASPDAPEYDFQRGYLDVTTKAFASPQMVRDEEWGDFPACFLAGNFPRVSCNTSEVTLRLSFLRVPDSDYEPLEYDGRKMELFGLFTNDRFGYDRRYGVVDDKWHRFASRWNVYEKSHADPRVPCAVAETTPPGTSPHRDEDKDGTEDECASVGRGSRCDEPKRACTIPLRDRAVRTIAWHVNRDYPDDLYDVAERVVNAWSDAARVGILAGRLAECRRTKQRSCEEEMGWPAQWADDFVPPVGSSSPAEVAPVFVLCHNPVREGENPLCGEVGTSPRIGDLRYNLFSLINSPQVASPWGIMMDAEDPLSGEKISGSVNQWSATLERAAAQLVDLVELLNGVTPPDQFIQGRDVSDWVTSARATMGGNTNAMSAAELAERKGAFSPAVMTRYAGRAPHAGPPSARRASRVSDLAAAGKLGAGNGAILERTSRLKGSEIEARMVTPEMAQAAGADPKADVTKGVIDRASPLGRSLPLMRRSLEKRGALGRAKRHSCRREAPETDHLLGLAKKAQKLFGSVDNKDAAKVKAHRDEIFAWARREYAMGVFSHEFGHSLGLRHNFAGTFDSLNYDEGYWQLRTKNGTVTSACQPGNTNGAGCIGPRYVDPLTQEEIDGNIGGFASSSVMDYPGDQSLDMFMMGKYDRAALRFAYGGVVDVWNGEGLSVKSSSAKAFELLAFDESVGLFGNFAFPQPGTTESKNMHYSRYAAEFGLISGCKSDPSSPLGTKCKGAPLDVVDARDMVDFAPVPEYASFHSIRGAVDGEGRVRRGYMFSSDEYSDSGNVPSFSYDAGADAYEQVRFLESAYENRYILDSFRRGRTTFNSWDVTMRVQSHYLDAIQLIAKTFAFAMMLEVYDPANPPPELLSDGNYGPLATGASIAFDLFARMLTRPEPGAYCSLANENCPGVQPAGALEYIYAADPFPLPQTTPYDFQIGVGTGRFIHNDYDYDQGYWWGDYQKQVGSFYDKVWATYYLAEAFDSFISNSKEDFVDGRYKNVNFATVYPNQTRRLFAALMTGDVETFAPWAGSASGSGIPTAQLEYPRWSALAGLGTRPAVPKIIDPSWGWNEQLYAMVWGTMLFPTTWSNTFIEEARITATANEQITWPASETITFVDPATGLVYRAHAIGTEMLFGMPKQLGVGARMLDWANQLVFEAYVVMTDAGGNYLLNADGTPRLVLTNGKPTPNPDFPGADAALKRYVANLDVMRQLTRTFVQPTDLGAP